jgi:chromate transporter
VTASPSRPRPSLGELARFFLRLGTTGFGGPIALVGYMERELVERRSWVTMREFADGLAFSQLAPGPLAAQLAIYLGWLVAGVPGWPLVAGPWAAPTSSLATLFVYFGSAGLFVFGSGLAIVPFLHGGVVVEHHWLTERQFLDAVAVALITPGPVVITVAFIGYLVAGALGAVAAAAGVFAPVYLMTLFLAPHYERFKANERVRAFVNGVTAAATGAIAGAAFVLGRRAVIDLATALIALVALGLLLGRRRIPEPLVIAAAGVAGVLITSGRGG